MDQDLLDRDLDDDEGWECSLCTFRNLPERFKCEMCSCLRRGTSTRKPRCNADTIVAQVVKQQEIIRQQTRATKVVPKNTQRPRSSTAGEPKAKVARRQAPKDSRKAKNDHNNHEQTDDEDDDAHEDDDDDEDDDEDDDDELNQSDSTEEATDLSEAQPSSNNNNSNNSKMRARSASESSIDSLNYSSSSSSNSPAPSAKVAGDNPFKVAKLEVDGNLIKYSPPTSSGRTGLIIDKKRFTQHSVTVNDVTITFTEFATRQNRYIRKKKKRRDASKSKNGSS